MSFSIFVSVVSETHFVIEENIVFKFLNNNIYFTVHICKHKHLSHFILISLFLQKKSREETCGEGSGVEILENKPYTDGPGGTGQYTHKVYHIGMHIPSWFRSILPKAALRVEEESWNAYPYTRTR